MNNPSLTASPRATAAQPTRLRYMPVIMFLILTPLTLIGFGAAALFAIRIIRLITLAISYWS